MSDTQRNVRYANWLRSPSFKNALVANARFVDEVSEAGFDPRPRDKALANPHGERVRTDWDDIHNSAFAESVGIPVWYDGPTYLECEAEDRFAQGPFVLENTKVKCCYFRQVYLCSPRNIRDFSKVQLADGSMLGLTKKDNQTLKVI